MDARGKVSTTYSLACTTCKEAIWIGQSGGGIQFYLYTADMVVIDHLQKFLLKHRSESVWSHPDDQLKLDHVLAFINDQPDLDDYTIDYCDGDPPIDYNTGNPAEEIK